MNLTFGEVALITAVVLLSVSAVAVIITGVVYHLTEWRA